MSKAEPSLKLLLVLGLPSFGLTFAVTILSAFLPSVLHSLTSPIAIGLIIGVEGIFGLFMPPIFGLLADRAHLVGQRFRYLLPATAAMAAGMTLLGVSAKLLLIVPMVALFYIGYYAYLAPYWALYPDLVPKQFSGRSRSAESVWRVVGSLAALISGGFLLSVWRPLPFLLSAGVVVGVTLGLTGFLSSRRRIKVQSHDTGFRQALGAEWHILRHNGAIRNLAIANALWNAALRSILTFVVLFFTVGLGRSHAFVSGVVFPIAAVGMLVMAPLSGKLADKYGHLKIIGGACLIYGLGDLLPGVTQQRWVFFVIPLVSGAAATVMTLPFALLMRLLTGEGHGVASGIFGFSRGAGSFLGPLLTGIAIELAGGHMAAKGYAAFWLATGSYVLASIFFLYRIRSAQKVQAL